MGAGGAGEAERSGRCVGGRDCMVALPGGDARQCLVSGGVARAEQSEAMQK